VAEVILVVHAVVTMLVLGKTLQETTMVHPFGVMFSGSKDTQHPMGNVNYLSTGRILSTNIFYFIPRSLCGKL
jgi:hypothetical protein